MLANSSSPLYFLSLTAMPGNRESEVGQAASVANSSVKQDAGSPKVLLADDNCDLLDAAAELFQLLGFETLKASSGAIAMEILRRTNA